MNNSVPETGVAPPAARYALAMSVPAGSAMFVSSGIVGERPDGSISDDIGGQAAEVWRSIASLLASAGFVTTDIVSYTTYAVVGHDLGNVMTARDAALGGHLCASTLIPVPALARPQWLVEIAVIAAR